MIEGSIERVKGCFLRGEALIESFCLCYWNMNSDGIIGSKFKESIVVFTPEIDKDSVWRNRTDCRRERRLEYYGRSCRGRNWPDSRLVSC